MWLFDCSITRPSSSPETSAGSFTSAWESGRKRGELAPIEKANKEDA
jgi:hypothetical protein